MKRTTLPLTITFLCLVSGLAALGLWGIRKTPAKAAAPPSVDALTAVPPASIRSASDQEIAHQADAARAKPQDDLAWVHLGDAFMQKARETADVTYYTHAEQVYQKALTLNPKRAEAMLGLAWVNGGRHQFEKSIDWANKALALNPRCNDAYGLIGDADVEMGNYDAAFTHYQKMMDIRPDISSYSRGAHLIYLMGDTRKGMWLMMKALKAGGPYAENTAWCRAQLGQMLFSDGAYLPAEQVLAVGLKKTPNNYHLLVTMGKVKAAKKDVPAAIACYKKAVAVAPQPDAVAMLGDLYALAGDKVEAQRQYTLVETISKLWKANGVLGDRILAQFYADHDRNLPEALQLAENEYKTRKNVYAADVLAWCYYKNGRYEDAKRLIDLAVEKKTPEALFLFHKGLIYAKVGDKETAKLALYQALSLNAQFHPVFTPMAEEAVRQLGSEAGVVRQAALR